MSDDPIVEEIRKIRDEHASKFKFDLRKIFQDFKSRQKRNKKKPVTLRPKKYLKATG